MYLYYNLIIPSRTSIYCSIRNCWSI